MSDGSRSASRRGTCSVECDKPLTWELSDDTMKRLTAVWFSMLSAAALAACAGAHIPPAPVTTVPGAQASTRDSSAVQLGTALATVEQDSAADQTALDSLHEKTPDSLSAPRTNVAVRGEDVRKEAEDLFGRDATATF